MSPRALTRSAGGGGGCSAVSGGFRSPIAVSTQLGHSSEKFSSFYQDLEHERSARRAAEVQARAALLEQIAKIEHAVDTEVCAEHRSTCHLGLELIRLSTAALRAALKWTESSQH